MLEDKKEKSKREIIREKALELLREHPEGIRYSQLVKALQESNQEIKVNTIHGSIWNLDKIYPDMVIKQGRGIFKLKKYEGFNQKEKSKREIIREKALEILTEHPDGIRYSNLVKTLQKIYPQIKVNTIHGSIYNLDEIYPNKVVKPSKGWYRLKIEEKDFYQKFAEFLIEKNICTKCVPYGFSRGGNKWENPDVIGVDQKQNAYNSKHIIISGELKTNSDWGSIIQGLGQAVSYRLFSHKTYLAIPKSISREDQRKIETLCANLDIGLVLFDETTPNDPKFEIRLEVKNLNDPDTLIYKQRISDFLDALFK
ncbi:MAG: hypothetical protein RXO36_04280 [Candidatus Nanopusillus acidilobi]